MGLTTGDDDEEESNKQDRETEGSGIMDKMGQNRIHRLYVSLGLTKAGNTSSKLQKAVV